MVLVVGWFSLVIEAFIQKSTLSNKTTTTTKIMGTTKRRRRSERLISSMSTYNNNNISFASSSPLIIIQLTLLSLLLMMMIISCSLMGTTSTKVIVLAQPQIFGSSSSNGNQRYALNTQSPTSYHFYHQRESSPPSLLQQRQQQQQQHQHHHHHHHQYNNNNHASSYNNQHAPSRQYEEEEEQQQQQHASNHPQALLARENSDSIASHLAYSGGGTSVNSPLAAMLSSSMSLERRLPSSPPTSSLSSISSQQMQQQQHPLVLPSCQLPATWAGKWYQKGNKDPIRFTNTEISDRGVCRDRKDDKFLFENRLTRCLVCMVINERHINVLQYKESGSEKCVKYTSQSLLSSSAMIQNVQPSHDILDEVCSGITGDTTLESLFRLDTPPIECPIIGQYTFTYDKCEVIPSSLESCIDKKQLNFKFSACPDVAGSESKNEVLKCYADWAEGSNYYMIGRLEPTTNNNVDRGKFRCFVYERKADGQTIAMAQSLEEDCYGLISATDGPRTMTLAAKPPTSRCNFPDYITTGRDAWLSVDNSLIYLFNQNSSNYQVKETREGNVIEEATCIKQVISPPSLQVSTSTRRHHQQQADTNQQQLPYHLSTSNSPPPYNNIDRESTYDQYLVQATKNCQTLTYCVRFHRRANSLIQIEFYQRSHHNDDTCSDIHPSTVPTYTIALTSADYQPCPFDGIYSIEAPLESDLSYNPSDLFVCPRQSFLSAYCDDSTLIHLHSKCTSTKTTTKHIRCLGNFYWPQQGSAVLLLEDEERQRYQAIIHREFQPIPHQNYMLNAGTNLQVSNDTFQQQLPPQHHNPYQQMRLSGSNQQQPFGATTLSSQQIINLSISPITSTNFKISHKNAMKVKLHRKSSCAEVSRSQSSSSSSSSSVSSSAASLSMAKSLQANSVILLIMTTGLSTILSLNYYCLKFLLILY